MMSNWLKIRILYYLLFIFCLYVVVNIAFNYIILSESFISQWYEGIITQMQIQEAISFLKKWEWTMILINIIIVFIKILSVSGCIYIGILFFLNKEYTYKISFNIALKAEIVFVFFVIIRLLWLRFVNIPESLEEINICPLSLMQFFDIAKIEPWLLYPLNTFNVFEVLYVWMLSSLMAVALQVKFRKAFEIVFVSYGAGLLLLIVTQMFLILNNT